MHRPAVHVWCVFCTPRGLLGAADPFLFWSNTLQVGRKELFEATKLVSLHMFQRKGSLLDGFMHGPVVHMKVLQAKVHVTFCTSHNFSAFEKLKLKCRKGQPSPLSSFAASIQGSLVHDSRSMEHVKTKEHVHVGRECSFSLLLVHVGRQGTTSIQNVHGYYPEVLAYKLKGPLVRVEWDDFGNQGTAHMPQSRADFEFAKKRDFCLIGIEDPMDNNAKTLSWTDNEEKGNLSFSLFNFSAYFKDERPLHMHKDLLTKLEQKYEGFFLHGPLVSYTVVINHVAVSKSPKGMSECQGLRVTSQAHGLSPYKTRWSIFSKKRDFCPFPDFNQCKGYPPDNNAKLCHWQDKADFLVPLPANLKDKRILSFLDMVSHDGPRVHVHMFKAFHFFTSSWDSGKCYIEMHQILFTSTGPLGPLVKVLKPMDFSQGLFVHGLHYPDHLCCSHGNGQFAVCSHPNASRTDVPFGTCLKIVFWDPLGFIYLLFRNMIPLGSVF